MTNEEITEKKQRGYNLTNDRFNELRTTYVQNLREISRDIIYIAKKVEEGGYLSAEDWRPVELLQDQYFQYWDGHNDIYEKLGKLFFVSKGVNNGGS